MWMDVTFHYSLWGVQAHYEIYFQNDEKDKGVLKRRLYQHTTKKPKQVKSILKQKLLNKIS